MQSTPAGTPSLSRRILDTFVAPRRMAAAVAAGASWAGPLLISTAVAVVAAAALPAEYFLSQVEEPVDRLGRPVTVTSAPEEVVRWGRYLQMFSAAVEHPVVILALAGVVTVVFSVIGSGGGEFRRYLSLTAHAFLITALGLLLTVGWHLFTGDTAAQPSLAPLAGGSRGAAGEALGLLNPFTLWTLVVMAVGIGELDGKRSFPVAAGILIGLYIGLALGLAALACGRPRPACPLAGRRRPTSGHQGPGRPVTAFLKSFPINDLGFHATRYRPRTEHGVSCPAAGGSPGRTAAPSAGPRRSHHRSPARENHHDASGYHVASGGGGRRPAPETPRGRRP